MRRLRTNWKSKGKKKKKGASDRVDLYALLGLQNERWTATELQIKNGAHASPTHPLSRAMSLHCDPGKACTWRALPRCQLVMPAPVKTVFTCPFETLLGFGGLFGRVPVLRRDGQSWDIPPAARLPRRQLCAPAQCRLPEGCAGAPPGQGRRGGSGRGAQGCHRGALQDNPGGVRNAVRPGAAARVRLRGRL